MSQLLNQPQAPSPSIQYSAEIPVVIAHLYSCPGYLIHALECAAGFNDKVVLIGDSSNQKLWGNHWNADTIKSPKYQQFMEHFFKMSDYPETFETSFWRRMFLLEDWMKLHHVEKAILLDSDVASFINYTSGIYPLLPENCLAALMIPQQDFASIGIWAASTHCSYWTLEGISSFTDFCIDSYANRNNVMEQLQSKHQWHLENQAPGGVCEMTLLYLWSLNNNRVYNLTEVFHDMVADWGVNSPSNYYKNEYRATFGIKHLVFKDGIPYGYNKLLKKQVKFLCVNCQGRSKIAMRYLASKRLKSFYFAIIYVDARIGKIKKFFTRKSSR